MRRLEGDNAWALQFLNLCVGSPWNATARSTQQGSTIQQKDELVSVKRAKRLYLRQNILDRYGRTAGFLVVLESGSAQRRSCLGDDMGWVDEWRGDWVRSRPCVRQFKAEGLRDDLFAGTPDTFFISDYSSLTSVLHLCESAFRYQEFKILATPGSVEWNEESFKALARVLMRQARDKYVFPTE